MLELDALAKEMCNPNLLRGHVKDGLYDTICLVNAQTRFGGHREFNLATS